MKIAVKLWSRVYWFAVGVSVAMGWGTSSVWAAQSPPERMTYQGFLVNENGSILGSNAPVNYDVIFRIYAAQTGGTSLWGEQQTVTVDKGYFSVLLGEGADTGSDSRPALSTVFQGDTTSDRYIAITVKRLGDNGSDVNILPRLRLVASPYAFLASRVVSGSIGASEIADGTITSAEIVDGTITGADIANSTLTGADIVDGAIVGTDVADGTITSADIADGTITAGKIATETITTANIVNRTLGGIDIALNTIGAPEILDGSITAADLAAGSVTRTQLISTIPYAEESNLRLIRGTVTVANGTIRYGSGFTAARLATGRVQITFNSPFTSVPSLTASITRWSDQGDNYAVVYSVSASGAELRGINRENGNLEDSDAISFIAIGSK